MPRTKESGRPTIANPTEWANPTAWMRYAEAIEAERDALRAHLIRDYLDQGYAEHEAVEIVNGIGCPE